jgi:hypothetical protein
MALSKLEPAHHASSISNLPDHDFSLMAAIGNTRVEAKRPVQMDRPFCFES